MDKKILGIVVAVIVVAIALVFFFNKPSTPTPVSTPPASSQPETSAPMTIPEPVIDPAARTIVVPLSAENNSGESGTATLMDVNGKTNVIIALTGAPTNITQPAHIHVGPCATIGAVRYPLTFPINGRSETTLDVSIDELLKQLPLAINVHKSTSEASIYVACGDIMNPNTPVQSAPSTGQPTINTPTTEDRVDGGTFSTPTDNRKGADKPEDN